MPAEKIEDRFNLEAGEGASIAMVDTLHREQSERQAFLQIKTVYP